MTLGNPSVSTKWGSFNAEMISGVRKTLEASGEDKRSAAVVKHEGQDLQVSFGWYLVEYVEGELAKRNTRGL